MGFIPSGFEGDGQLLACCANLTIHQYVFSMISRLRGFLMGRSLLACRPATVAFINTSNE